MHHDHNIQNMHSLCVTSSFLSILEQIMWSWGKRLQNDGALYFVCFFLGHSVYQGLKMACSDIATVLFELFIIKIVHKVQIYVLYKEYKDDAQLKHHSS